MMKTDGEISNTCHTEEFHMPSIISDFLHQPQMYFRAEQYCCAIKLLKVVGLNVSGLTASAEYFQIWLISKYNDYKVKMETHSQTTEYCVLLHTGTMEYM
jgi:hypothetical protein